jgi:hypothetical protein
MLGDMRHGVQDRTPIFFILLEIRNSIKRLQLKQNLFVLAKQEKTFVQ